MSSKAYDFVDDGQVEDQEEIWRRVPAVHVVPNSNVDEPSCYVLSSAVFSDSSVEHSVEEVKVMSDGKSPMSCSRALGNTVESFLHDHAAKGAVAIGVGLVRGLGLGIDIDPREDDEHHLLVFGRKPKSVQRALARKARWLKKVPGKENTCPESG